jgi:hypothetical protein
MGMNLFFLDQYLGILLSMTLVAPLLDAGNQMSILAGRR